MLYFSHEQDPEILLLKSLLGAGTECPTHGEQFNVFWQSNMASDWEVLTLFPATPHCKQHYYMLILGKHPLAVSLISERLLVRYETEAAWESTLSYTRDTQPLLMSVPKFIDIFWRSLF